MPYDPDEPGFERPGGAIRAVAAANAERGFVERPMGFPLRAPVNAGEAKAQGLPWPPPLVGGAPPHAAGSLPASPCRTCPKPVAWARVGESMMPLDPSPVRGGNIRVLGIEQGRILAAIATFFDPPGLRYVRHLCP